MRLSHFLHARIAEDEARMNTYARAIWDSTDHDQRRLLADCEARRRVVGLHTDEHYCPTIDDGSVYFNYLEGWAEEAEHPQLCPVLRLLALPYADHRDYEPDWRP